LTDYALDELPAHERIYVESMLAASEECRNDVCQMIEMARLLEQGYEREVVAAEIRALSLNAEQRTELGKPHFTMRCVLRDVASALSLAACVAFAITKFDAASIEGARTAAGKVASASVQAAASVQAPEGIDLAKALASLREMAEESSKLIPVSADALPEPPAICTPPTLVLESAQLTAFGDMTK
jgi:anti-sigma factor RsiW